MKMTSHALVLAGCFAISSVQANPFDETFAGLARPALQDTLGRDSPWDPFVAAANPAWVRPGSAAALSSSVFTPQLGQRAQENTSTVLFQIAAQKTWSATSAGVLASIPVGASSLLDTGDGHGQLPLWTGRARAITLWPFVSHSFEDTGWSVGVSLPVIFDIDSLAEIKQHDDGSYARVRGGSSPRASYALGAAYKEAGETGWSFSALYRERQLGRIDASVTADIPIPNFAGISMMAQGISNYSFTPRRLLLQGARDLGHGLRLGAMLRYSNWKEMPSPFLDFSKSAPQIVTLVPSFPARDTLEAAWGGGYQVSERLELFGSYRFQPTPLKSDHGFYDRDQHVVAVGAGWWNMASLDRVYLTSRLHFLQGGGLYTWFGLGVGSEL